MCVRRTVAGDFHSEYTQAMVWLQQTDGAASRIDVVDEACKVAFLLLFRLRKCSWRSLTCIRNSCDLLDNPLPGGLARKTEGLVSTQALLADVVRYQQEEDDPQSARTGDVVLSLISFKLLPAIQ